MGGAIELDIRVPYCSQSINLSAAINSLVFVGLNLADAWLTKQLLAYGGGEANAIVSLYGGSMLIKGFLAVAIVLILVRLGKAKLLKVLNVCMMAVVLWTSIWMLTYL